MAVLNIMGIQELLVFVIVICCVFLLPVIALVDIVRSKFEGNMQLIWVLIVVFINFIGALLYFALGKKQKIKQKEVMPED